MQTRNAHQITHYSQAPPTQALGVFTSVIVICSLGALAVTVQAKVSTFYMHTFLRLMLCVVASRRTSVRATHIVNANGTSTHLWWQVLLPRPLCSWLLHSSSWYCCAYLLLCSYYLDSCACCTIRLGMEHMGWVIWFAFKTLLTLYKSIC